MALTKTQIEGISSIFGEQAGNVIERIETIGKSAKSIAEVGTRFKQFSTLEDEKVETDINLKAGQSDFNIVVIESLEEMDLRLDEAVKMLGVMIEEFKSLSKKYDEYDGKVRSILEAKPSSITDNETFALNNESVKDAIDKQSNNLQDEAFPGLFD